MSENGEALAKAQLEVLLANFDPVQLDQLDREVKTFRREACFLTGDLPHSWMLRIARKVADSKEAA
jgi:hypothetical protein